MEISKNVKVLENKINENVRNYSFDVLRILACFGVIFNHTVMTRTFKYFPSPIGYLSLFPYYFYRTAVPIFFMISGALLIPKEESLKKLFTKRILRMVIALSVFTFILNLIYGRINITSTP